MNPPGVWGETKNQFLEVMDFSLKLKQILFCTASLLQCFIIQLCTSRAGKLRILENSKYIKSKTQLVLGKHGNVPVPYTVGSWFSAGAERTDPGGRAGVGTAEVRA